MFEALGLETPNSTIEKVDSAALNAYLADSGNDFHDILKSRTWSMYQQSMLGLSKVPTDGDFKAFIDTYAVFPWVYIASWIISSSIASLPLQVIRNADKDDEEIITDSPLNELLANPNSHDTKSSWIEFLVLNLELSGNAYTEKGDILKELPVNMFGLESGSMRILPDPEKKVGGYCFTSPIGTDEIYEPEEIIHMKYANPASQFYGQGAIKVLQLTLVTELMREQYNKNFFENEARPDVILKQNPDASKGVPPVSLPALKEVAAKWRSAYGGAKNTRLPVVLPAGLDVSLLTETGQDMHYREFEKSLRERVLGAMGVPPALAGLFEFANYANVKEQMKIFWQVTIPPKARVIEEALTKFLAKPYDKSLSIRFDRTNIEALGEDEAEKTARLNSQFDRGAMNRNEMRLAQGKEKLDDPNAEKYFVLQGYVPVDDLFAEDFTEEGSGAGDTVDDKPAGEDENVLDQEA